jgi:hypothetical protein
MLDFSMYNGVVRRVKIVPFAMLAVSVSFGCSPNSPNHNIPENLLGVFRATKGTVYSESLTEASLPMPADLSEIVARDSKLKGRALTRAEVAEVLALLHALDRVEIPAQTPACAPSPQLIVRLELATELYVIPIDSKCVHIAFVSPAPRRTAMVYGSYESGFVDWARKIDPISLSK